MKKWTSFCMKQHSLRWRNMSKYLNFINKLCGKTSWVYETENLAKEGQMIANLVYPLLGYLSHFLSNGPMPSVGDIAPAPFTERYNVLWLGALNLPATSALCTAGGQNIAPVLHNFLGRCMVYVVLPIQCNCTFWHLSRHNPSLFDVRFCQSDTWLLVDFF